MDDVDKHLYAVHVKLSQSMDHAACGLGAGIPGISEQGSALAL